MRENYHYHTLEEVQQFAESVGCKCLDIEYKNDKHLMTFIPSCGHGIINESYKSLRIGKYYQLCENCRKEYFSNKCHYNNRLISFSDIKEIIESTGCKLHTIESEYYNTHDSLLDIELTCGCHKHVSFHGWNGAFKDTTSRYNRALICSSHYWTNYRLSEIEKNECKYISGDLLHDMSKITIECKCGHLRETTFNAFKYNKLYICKNCSNKHISEQQLFNIIQEKYPDTIYQYAIFTDRYQWIDYFIPSKNVAIEYHGPQHYEMCKWFFKTEKEFLRRLELDKNKESWCKENCNKYIVIDGRIWNKCNFHTKKFLDYIDNVLNSF